MSDIENVASTINKGFTKKAIRLFIIIILFLTFFSKTINNFMLPQVDVINPLGGSLVRKIDGHGVIKAKDSYEFYTNSSIKVLSVNVKPGQLVKKGQMIMVLDKKELEKKLQDYLIILEQKKIELQKLINDDVDQRYMTDIESAREEVEQCKKDFQTTKTLYEAGIETQKKVEESEIELKASQRKYNKILKNKEQAFNDHKLDIRNSELDIQLHQNKIIRLREELNDVNNITAPTDGVIKEINFSRGSITDSSKPLFNMTDATNGFELKVTVDSSKASYLSIGDKAIVKVTSLGGVKLEGKILHINDSLQIEEEKKDIFIELDSANLKGGEHAEIHIVKETKYYEMLIPNEGIRKDNNKNLHVLILQERDGVFGKEYYVQKSRVFSEGSDNLNTAIVNGLSFLDKVIIGSSRPISNGSRVKLNNK